MENYDFIEIADMCSELLERVAPDITTDKLFRSIYNGDLDDTEDMGLFLLDKDDRLGSKLEKLISNTFMDAPDMLDVKSITLTYDELFLFRCRLLAAQTYLRYLAQVLSPGECNRLLHVSVYTTSECDAFLWATIHFWRVVRLQFSKTKLREFVSS